MAPVLGPEHPDSDLAEVTLWLPEGEWIDTARGCHETGGQWLTQQYAIDEIPVFVRPGTIIPGQVGSKRLNTRSIDHLLVTIYGGTEGAYTLYEDDGQTVNYQQDECVQMTIAHQTLGKTRTVTFDQPDGHYEGYLATKEIQVRLVNVAPPKCIRIGGKELP